MPDKYVKDKLKTIKNMTDAIIQKDLTMIKYFHKTVKKSNWNRLLCREMAKYGNIEGLQYARES